MIYEIETLEETKKLAEDIAFKTSLGNVITLNGTLGSGKTYFCNCFINYFFKKYNLKQQEILSPTFNIVKEYKINDFSIFHFDLYRIKNEKELLEFDLENCFENNISLIEWPKICESLIYNIKFNINIEIIKNKRIFKLIDNN